jgi:L-alanine-DL-glutamate epimerase-like enolase superfamily enzyme
MRITAVSAFELEGVIEVEEGYWTERTARPVDIYAEDAARWENPFPPGRQPIRSRFIEIESDEGVTGRAGSISVDEVEIVRRHMASLLIGQDPQATECIWDRLYRWFVSGRKGIFMHAISAVDCALWDLKGKWFGVPVYRLLGGPTRETIPVYAQMLGFSLDLDLVRKTAESLVAQGFQAMKWYPRFGPSHGAEGMAYNERLVATLRETAGPDVDIMLDCWYSWDVYYTIEMARRLEKYQLRWIETPVMPDKIDACAEIRRRTSVPIAAGEHEYTRWGFKALLNAGAVDILQPDLYWAGGISELMKICALASVYDVPVIPHVCVVPPTVHLIAAQSSAMCPMLEYSIKGNETGGQFFLSHPIKAENGQVTLPEAPGLGLELAETEIVRRTELFRITRA